MPRKYDGAFHTLCSSFSQAFCPHFDSCINCTSISNGYCYPWQEKKKFTKDVYLVLLMIKSHHLVLDLWSTLWPPISPLWSLDSFHEEMSAIPKIRQNVRVGLKALFDHQREWEIINKNFKKGPGPPGTWLVLASYLTDQKKGRKGEKGGLLCCNDYSSISAKVKCLNKK